MGVVVGTIVVLMTAVTTTRVGAISEARYERAGLEMKNLLTIGTSFFYRNAQIGLDCDPADSDETDGAAIIAGDCTGQTNFRMELDLAGRDSVVLSDDGADTLSLDFSNEDDQDLMREFFRQGFDGRNPFDMPYTIEFQRRRMTVRTCVPRPEGDAALRPQHFGTEAGFVTINQAGCDGCGASDCVQLSKAYPPGRMHKLMSRKKYVHWGQ
jgi:hypothetical protein